MKYMILVLMLLLTVGMVSAVTGPLNHNGKNYYVVTSTDATEDSGSEVCAKVGMHCNGYSEVSSAVCKLAHPNAAESSGLSGDLTGIYCDGAPQNGVCASLTDTCVTCPQCTKSVTCDQTISGLYREMYVECVPASASRPCNPKHAQCNYHQTQEHSSKMDSHL